MMRLAIAGCGVMGRRHVRGLGRLRAVGRQRFELVAAIDPVASSADALADLAAELLGARPRTYPDLAAALADGALDALDIAAAPNLHLPIAREALAAGLHLLVEKPIALTTRQGLALVAAGEAAGRVVSVAENYRRDPINRLAKALIDAGAIGRPYLAVQSSSGAGEQVIITPWRHRRASGGIAVDMGVHYADILEYLLGPIDTVAGMGAVVDAERIAADGSRHPADAEDLAVGVLRFASGTIANLVLDMAGRGAGHFTRVVYGSRGSLAIPQDRTGHPLVLDVREAGVTRTLSDAEALALVPDFALDATTAALFGGDRLARYTADFATIDANLLAIEFDDLADAIARGVAPEVDGLQGARSLAIAYGLLESERLGRFVAVGRLLAGADSPYQDALDGGAA
jgi:predicted dehydrogenase